MNSKFIIIKCFIIFFLLFCASLMSVYSYYPMVRNFQRSQYKAGAQNWSIEQDPFNTMYFANNSGLMEFDGRNWVTYPILDGTDVRSIFFSANGRIYASTFNEFGYFERQSNGRFGYFSLLKQTGIDPVGSNELYSIHKGVNNTLYFQAEQVIYEYTGDTIIQYPFNHKIDASAFVHNVLFITTSEMGAYMLNGNLFVRIPGSEIIVGKKVAAILPYKNDQILFVTSFHGAFLFDGNDINPYNTGIDEFLKTNQVFCAASQEHQIVFGTVQRGIAVLNTQNGEVLYNNTYTGLQNNTVLSVRFDRHRNLWLGLDKGIDYVRLNDAVLQMFGTNNLYGAGYSSLQKGRLIYFGTNQGLYYSTYPVENAPSPLQLSLVAGMEGQVWSITEIDKTIFCGTDQGAFIINGERAERIPGLGGTWGFQLLKNRNDMIIGCSYRGLFVLQKKQGRWQLAHFLKGDFQESSPMFEQDDSGSIWFSHWQKGLFRLFMNSEFDSIVKVTHFNESKGLPFNRNNTVFKINDELIFSSESGFFRYNQQSDNMIPCNEWNNLFEGTPSYMRLHESPTGDVWCVSGSFVGLATRKGDRLYEMDSLSYQSLKSKIISGFEHFNFIEPHKVILGTEDGFCLIRTDQQISTDYEFKVYLRQILMNDGGGMTLFGFSQQNNRNSTDSFLKKNNTLRFEFIAPEYREDGMVVYSLRLENYDDVWSEYSADNFKEYTQLPRGNYTFRVRARNLIDGREADYSYKFVILPAWYETQLAFSVYFLLGLIMVSALIMLINYRSKKGAREMERVKELEIAEQKKLFDAETSEKKREIKELKNQQLQYELRHKSQELASSTMNLIRKNEMLIEMMSDLSRVTDEIKKSGDSNVILSRLTRMERAIQKNIETDNNWKKFEENFDLVYENYLKRLSEEFPELNISDKKLCAYLKMDLSSKDIAPLMNMSVRSVETNRYRLRRKMGLERDVNLAEYLQRL